MDKKKLAEHAAEDLLASHEAILQQAKALEIYPQLSNSTLQLVEQLKVRRNIVLICLNSKTALRR